MYKPFIRKITDKFLFLKKAEEKYFPIALKEIEIPQQQSNFDKIKALLKKSSNQKAIIDAAIERQIEEHLYFAKVLLHSSTEEKTNKIDLEIFDAVVGDIFTLSTSRNYEEKLDTLFKIYIRSALYVEKYDFSYFNNINLTKESLGSNYAIRCIHRGFIMFIYSVEDIEL